MKSVIAIAATCAVVLLTGCDPKCQAGQYLLENKCVDCKADHYCTGGTQPVQCEAGKTVASGAGKVKDDCKVAQMVLSEVSKDNSNNVGKSGVVDNLVVNGEEKKANPAPGNIEIKLTSEAVTTCNPGKYPVYQACVACPADHYCTGSAQPVKCEGTKKVAIGAGTSQADCTDEVIVAPNAKTEGQ